MKISTHSPLQKKTLSAVRAIFLSGTALATSGYADQLQANNSLYAARQSPDFMDEVCDCMQVNATDDALQQLPPENISLWYYTKKIGASRTLMGPALTQMAEAADLYYCFKELPPNQVGEFCNSDGIVKLADHARDRPAESNILTSVHEMIHAMQGINGLLAEDRTWTIGQLQMSTLSYEAAAEAGEAVIALEFKISGDNSLWDSIMTNNAALGQKTLGAYETAIEKGAKHYQAITAAGAAAFNEQISQQWWLDFYNNRILARYAYLLDGGFQKAPSNHVYTVGTARNTGYITPDFNFTAEVQKFPPYAKRFGNNREMHQAFDYAYLEHLRLTLGEKDAIYLKTLAQLKKEKNPYLGIDIKEAYKRWDEDETNTSFLVILDIMAIEKFSPKISPALDPLSSTLPKVDMFR